LAESEGSPKGMPSTESNGEYNFDRPRIVWAIPDGGPLAWSGVNTSICISV
jgi:hypothetical protein